jgi:hypothetical protein
MPPSLQSRDEIVLQPSQERQRCVQVLTLFPLETLLQGLYSVQ